MRRHGLEHVLGQDGELERLVHSCGSKSDLALAMETLRTELAFEHLLYHPLPLGPELSEASTQLLTYPREWVDRYVSQQYFKIDPVVRSGREGIAPFEWSVDDDHTSEAVSAFLRDAQNYGVGRRGLILPVYDSLGRAALFGLTSNYSDAEWARLPWAHLRTVASVARSIHDRALALDALSQPRLTTGEIACLALLLQGSTPKHAAGKLGISENRVRVVLHNACVKLHCRTTTQAVAVAHGKKLIA